MSDNIVNEIIKSLESAIGNLKTEIANIEETYRKKLEEAKVALAEQLEESEAQLHYWFTVRGDLPPVEKKTRRARTKKVAAAESQAEEEKKESNEDKEEPQEVTEEVVEQAPAESENMEKVIDTLFPENNEEETQETAEESDSPEGDEGKIAEDLKEVWPDNDGFEEKDLAGEVSDDFPEEWN